jgi:DNA-binding MarR family transcriptional regulator
MRSVSQESFGLLVGRAQRLLQQAVNELAEPHDINAQQLWILLMLLEGIDLAARDLAARLFIDKATASRLIERLVRRRWLQMTPTPGDKRRLRLQLTVAGARLAKKLHQSALALDKRMLDGIGLAELAVAVPTLRRVIANLGGPPA